MEAPASERSLWSGASGASSAPCSALFTPGLETGAVRVPSQSFQSRCCLSNDLDHRFEGCEEPAAGSHRGTGITEVPNVLVACLCSVSLQMKLNVTKRTALVGG